MFAEIYDKHNLFLALSVPSKQTNDSYAAKILKVFRCAKAPLQLAVSVGWSVGRLDGKRIRSTIHTARILGLLGRVFIMKLFMISFLHHFIGGD